MDTAKRFEARVTSITHAIVNQIIIFLDQPLPVKEQTLGNLVVNPVADANGGSESSQSARMRKERGITHDRG